MCGDRVFGGRVGRAWDDLHGGIGSDLRAEGRGDSDDGVGALDVRRIVREELAAAIEKVGEEMGWESAEKNWIARSRRLAHAIRGG